MDGEACTHTQHDDPRSRWNAGIHQFLQLEPYGCRRYVAVLPKHTAGGSELCIRQFQAILQGRKNLLSSPVLSSETQIRGKGQLITSMNTYAFPAATPGEMPSPRQTRIALSLGVLFLLIHIFFNFYF